MIERTDRPIVTKQKMAVAMTGIEYFGLKVCLLVPTNLDIDPKEAAEGFTKQMTGALKRAGEPTMNEVFDVIIKNQLEMCEN